MIFDKGILIFEEISKMLRCCDQEEKSKLQDEFRKLKYHQRILKREIEIDEREKNGLLDSIPKYLNIAVELVVTVLIIVASLSSFSFIRKHS